MKRKMLTICLVAVLICTADVWAGQKAEEATRAQKAFQLRLNGKSHEAKEVLTEYLKEHPDDAGAQFEYSRVLCYLFDLEEAEKHAKLAAQLDDDNARYRYWQGMCGTFLYIDQAHHKGNLDSSIIKQAIDAFQKAIELKPDYHEARYLLVNLFNNNEADQGGDPQKARQHTEYLMEKDLDYGLQALMVVEQNQSVDWKVGQYQKALAKEPDSAGLHAGIGLLYAESGQMDKSQEHINKAMGLDDSQKDVLLDVIFPLAMKKDYETAKSLVRRYLELAVDEPAAMRAFGTFYLAKLEKMSGDPNADKTLEQSRQIDPDVWMTMKAPPAMLFEPIG